MKISKKCVHQVLACVPAILAEFVTGLGWGWTAPTLSKLQSADADFQITAHQASWLVSIGEIGRLSSPLLSALLLDNIGRKSTLLVASVTYVLVWSAVTCTRDVYILLATRTLFGIGNGLTDLTSGIYAAETCSPNLRGTITGAIVLSCLAGMTFEFCVSAYLSYTNVAIVNTVLAICAVGSQYWGVETTYVLTMQGKHERAKKNFTWLQVGHRDIEGEMQKIRKNVEEEKQKRKSFGSLFASTTNLGALFVAIGFNLLLSTVGFQVVVPYASTILVSSERFTADEYTIMFGAAKFIGTAISLFIVEKVDRRPLILASFATIAGCNICMSLLLYLHGKHYDIAFYPWLLFACLATFGFVSCLMISAALTFTNEILPLSIRAIGGCIGTTAGAIGSFVTTVMFWPITQRFGMETNFFVYTTTSVLATIFIYLTLPETRNKTLHEMHEKPRETEE